MSDQQNDQQQPEQSQPQQERQVEQTRRSGGKQFQQKGAEKRG